MVSLPWQGNSEATWTHDSASCPRMAVPMRLSSWLCLDWREWTGIIWYLRSVSHASVLVTVCFSGSGDSFSGSGDRLFQWFWWLLHWVWWQSVSVVLVTVCFTGSGDSLVLCQHHEVEENELTSSGLGGSRSASWGWRECADLFWFGRFSVSISSMKRRSWHLLIWEVSCEHHEVEETELILSYLDLFVFLSALWGWRDWADIVIFGFVCFSVSIVRLKRLSWYCLIWKVLCQHLKFQRMSWYHLIWEVLCWHHGFEENEMVYDTGGHSSVFLCLLDDLPFDQLLYTLYVLVLCFDVSCFSLIMKWTCLGLTWERALWDPTFVIIIVCEYLAVGRVLMPWYLGGVV